MDAAALFARAHRAFAAGQLPAARQDLLALIAAEPGHATALHLLGATEKAMGNRESAAHHFARALLLAPANAALASDAANLAAAMGQVDHALTLYDRAIALAPDRPDFRLNRAVALIDAGRAAQALDDAAMLTARPAADARTWSVAGQIYDQTGDYARARYAFTQALAREPQRLIPLFGLGRIMLAEGDAGGLAHLEQAHRLAPQDQAIRLAYAEGLEMVGRFANAIALLDAGTAQAPDWITGHRSLARMRGEAGDGAGDEAGAGSHAGFERALAARPGNVDLWASYAAFLRSEDAVDGALAVLDRAVQTVGPQPILALIAAGIADDRGDSECAAALLADVPLNHPAGVSVRMRHLIRAGRPDEASAFAVPHLSAEPDNIALWALTSLCWRMMGDPREDWLNPPGGLYGVRDIGIPGPPGALADLLRRLHVARHHPAGQSLRHGTQTRGSLFRRREPEIAALRAHIANAVAAHMAELPPVDPSHPLLKHKDRLLDFSGSWSVRLVDSGFHISHIHPAGVLSSAFYVALPHEEGVGDAATDGTGEGSGNGALAVGDAPPELATGLAPYALIEPRLGRLVLFPSYLFHGTRPIGHGERMTVAFDVA